MNFKEQLSKITGIPKEELPTGYQMIGDIVILQLKNGNEEKIAKAVSEIIPNAKTVCVKTGEITGEYREPSIKKIWGSITETTHHEHDCLFTFDVTKIMWAKGNMNERKRIASQPKKGENILDMFAGIGYFSIPLAKHNPTCQVLSIEKNPNAIHYLKKNAEINKLKNITIKEGDSMTDTPNKWADRIIMGYIPEPIGFLKSAFKALKDKGVIHYEGVRNTGEEESLFLPVKEEGIKQGYECKLLHTQTVKSYGPKRWHIVVDVECIKKNE